MSDAVLAFPPLLMRREAAAHYLGVSVRQFDACRGREGFPKGSRPLGTLIWRRDELEAFVAVDHPAAVNDNSWADV